ncbi:Cytochrome P450 3A56 [Toxocara canis]|uniref:Cytochrome P450 3A56 n=1 Tax=Toxocara canis TaxID=6265 RepID=A0A0B2UIA3_TOXCA|nr:Cytochrome P450 3A56 [Toxocara canis]
MRIGLGEKAVLLLIVTATLFRVFALPTALTFSLIIVAVLLRMQNARNHYWQQQGIEGPEPNLFFGSTFQLKNGIKDFDIENTRKYGTVFSTVFVGVPVLVVSDLELLKEILVKKFAFFSNRAIVNDVIGNNKNGIRSKVMFALRDTLWKNVRNTITPAFTTGKMKMMTPILGDCIEQMMSAIEKTIEDINGEFDVKKVCGNLTMDESPDAHLVYTQMLNVKKSPNL